MRKLLFALISAGWGLCGLAESPSLWQVGEGRIERRMVSGQAVKDHFAMSGRTVDVIGEWAVGTNQAFSSSAFVRWPMLRTLPDDTHASLPAAPAVVVVQGYAAERVGVRLPFDAGDLAHLGRQDPAARDVAGT